MKIYRQPIDELQIGWMFSPIRSKNDALVLLVRALKVFLAPTHVPDERVKGEVAIVVSKMSRLFFSSPAKIFSISLPFHVTESNSGLTFKSPGHPNVDSRATSELLSLLEGNLLSVNEVFSFADIVQTACDIDVDIWNLLKELLLLEDGYVRYDFDEENADGETHPLHHVDIFYSQGTTFKAGLDKGVERDELSDILDITTACRYLR